MERILPSKLGDLPSNIRLGYKGLPDTSCLAYYTKMKVTQNELIKQKAKMSKLESISKTNLLTTIAHYFGKLGRFCVRE